MGINTTLSDNLPFDIVFTTSDGLKVELMLARGADSNGNPLPKAWSMSEVPSPTNVRVSDTGAGLVDLPPEVEAVFFRDDHRGGLGTTQVDINNTDYMSGVMHTTVAGKVLPPPSVNEISLPTSEGDVRVWVEAVFSGTRYLYVSDGRYLHRTSDGVTFAQVLDVGSGKAITSAVFYGAADGDTGLVVAYETTSTGAASPYKYSNDGTTFSDADSGGSRECHYLFVSDQTLYSLKNPNNLFSSTDPYSSTATWSGSTVVGDEAHDFQGGIVVADVLVLPKEDQVYTYNATDGVRTLIAQFAEQADEDNFKWFAAAYNSNIYFTVDEEIWEYDPVNGDLRAIGQSTLPDTLLSPSTSHNDGLAYDGIALYSIHHAKLPDETTGGTTILRITQDTDGVFRFERWLTTTSSGYRPQGPMHASRAFNTRKTGRALYFNTLTAGKVGVINVPRATDPTLDSSAEYSTVSAKLFSGWIVHNFPGQPKDYTEVTVDLAGITPTCTAAVYYYLDGDTSTRYTLTSSITTSGLHVLQFPGPVTARSMLLEFVLSPGAVTDEPVLFSWTLRAAVKFRMRELGQVTVRVTDYDRGRGGAISKHTAVDIRSLLRRLRTKEDIRIRYQDYRGYDFRNVRVLPGFQEVDAVDEDTGTDMTALSFRFLKVED